MVESDETGKKAIRPESTPLTRSYLRVFQVLVVSAGVLLAASMIFGSKNNLEVHYVLTILLWFVLYPLLILASLYYCFVVHPRWVRQGVELQ